MGSRASGEVEGMEHIGAFKQAIRPVLTDFILKDDLCSLPPDGIETAWLQHCQTVLSTCLLPVLHSLCEHQRSETVAASWIVDLFRLPGKVRQEG